tara:strand:- start:111 stop:296 length:186 start_codon:yes stop_codon:yes gene_type:complete
MLDEEHYVKVGIRRTNEIYSSILELITDTDPRMLVFLSEEARERIRSALQAVLTAGIARLG